MNRKARRTALPLRDEDLARITGGTGQSAITTLEWPVQYRSTGPAPRAALPAGFFDLRLHGWGHH